MHVFVTRDMNDNGVGYGWIFYFGDGKANVGAGVSTRALAHTGRNLKDFFDRFLEEPQISAWFEGAEPEGHAKSWSLKMGCGAPSATPKGSLCSGMRKT